MTSVTVKIVTLNQCEVIWNRIAVVAAMLLVIKKETYRFVTESQNCLVLPAPHKRASRPAPDFYGFILLRTKR